MVRRETPEVLSKKLPVKQREKPHIIVRVPVEKNRPQKTAQELVQEVGTTRYKVQSIGRDVQLQPIQRIQQARQTYQTRPRTALTKSKIARQPMVRRESAGKIASFITGKRVLYSGTKGYSGRGRPKGSFYKYTIPGVGPVDVFTWRKWNRQQQRLLAAQLSAQTGASYNQAIQSVRAGIRPSVSIQKQPIQLPQTQVIMQPQAQQSQIQTIQEPISDNGEIVGYQQTQPQQFDDGWGLLRIKSPISMIGNNAPARPFNPIANAQMPIGNKYTSYYSEPNFFGSSQVMRQRPNVGGFGLW